MGGTRVDRQHRGVGWHLQLHFVGIERSNLDSGRVHFLLAIKVRTYAGCVAGVFGFEGGNGASRGMNQGNHRWRPHILQSL